MKCFEIIRRKYVAKIIFYRYICVNLTCKSWNCALHSGVARETDWAGAHRFVINSLAEGIDAARTDAGIPAFLREACLVAWTVGVDDALGIDADCDAVLHSALAVVIARRRTAGIGF